PGFAVADARLLSRLERRARCRACARPWPVEVHRPGPAGNPAGAVPDRREEGHQPTAGAGRGRWGRPGRWQSDLRGRRPSGRVVQESAIALSATRRGTDMTQANGTRRVAITGLGI